VSPDGDPPPDAERAQWERARQVQADREAQRLQTQADREDAQAAATAGASSRGRSYAIGLAVLIAVLAATAVVVVAIGRRSSQQPAWVRQLGLQNPDTGSAPQRYATVSTDDAGPPTTSSSGAGTIDETSNTPPLIDTTGEDFLHIYRQIEVLEDWLLLHPHPALASRIYVPGSPPSNQLVTLLGQLQTEHHVLDVKGYRVVGVEVKRRPSSDVVDLEYADTYTDRVELDAHGRVVADAPYDGRSRLWTLTLQRKADGRWRVAATAFVGYGAVVGSG
jgi:hypothetical protein